MRCLCSRLWVIRDECQTQSGRQLPSLGCPKPCGNIHSNPQKPVEAATLGPVRGEMPWQGTMVGSSGSHSETATQRLLAPRQKQGETSRVGMRTECPTGCQGQALDRLCDPGRSQAYSVPLLLWRPAYGPQSSSPQG